MKELMNDQKAHENYYCYEAMKHSTELSTVRLQTNCYLIKYLKYLTAYRITNSL